MRRNAVMSRRVLATLTALVAASVTTPTAHAYPYVVPEYFEVRGAWTTGIGLLSKDAPTGSGLTNLGTGWGVEAIHGGAFPSFDILFRGAGWQSGRFELVRDRYQGGPSQLGAVHLDLGAMLFAFREGPVRFETNAGLGVGMRWASWDQPRLDTVSVPKAAATITQPPHLTHSFTAISGEIVVRQSVLTDITERLALVVGVEFTGDVWTLQDELGIAAQGPFPTVSLWPRIDIGLRGQIGTQPPRGHN